MQSFGLRLTGFTFLAFLVMMVLWYIVASVFQGFAMIIAPFVIVVALVDFALFVIGLVIFSFSWLLSLGDGGGGGSSYHPVSSGNLDEKISRAGTVAAWVTSGGAIHYISFSGPVGRVTASGDVYLDIMGHAGRVRSDGVVERDGIGPVLAIHPDGRITEGGSYFATANPAMNRIHAGAGALALLIYIAAA